jgi:hypothetical protein
MYRDLIIGTGEVGTSLFHTLAGHDQVFTKDIEPKETISDIDVIHICFPYSHRFISQVKDYIEQYDPIFTIVYSSVPIGTCDSIGTDIVHSPVEGVHPKLEDSFYSFTRWLGCEDQETLESASRFWYRFVREVITCKSSRYTEFLKLRSTAKYGVNLVWADYEKQVADELGMNYDMVKEYDSGYNKLYRDLGLYKYQRYVLDPPEGFIGGHCVRPNAKLLDDQYPNPILKTIKRMNKGEAK